MKREESDSGPSSNENTKESEKRISRRKHNNNSTNDYDESSPKQHRPRITKLFEKKAKYEHNHREESYGNSEGLGDSCYV